MFVKAVFTFRPVVLNCISLSSSYLINFQLSVAHWENVAL